MNEWTRVEVARIISQWRFREYGAGGNTRARHSLPTCSGLKGQFLVEVRTNITHRNVIPGQRRRKLGRSILQTCPEELCFPRFGRRRLYTTSRSSMSEAYSPLRRTNFQGTLRECRGKQCLRTSTACRKSKTVCLFYCIIARPQIRRVYGSKPDCVTTSIHHQWPDNDYNDNDKPLSLNNIINITRFHYQILFLTWVINQCKRSSITRFTLRLWPKMDKEENEGMFEPLHPPPPLQMGSNCFNVPAS